MAQIGGHDYSYFSLHFRRPKLSALVFATLALLMGGVTFKAQAQPKTCDELLLPPGKSSGPTAKPTEFRPDPKRWLRLSEKIFREQAKLPRRFTHPFSLAGEDPDAIGRVHLRFEKMIPDYREMVKWVSADHRRLTPQEFQNLKSHYGALIAKSLRNVRSQNLPVADRADSLFAQLELVRHLAELETRVEFPKHSLDNDGRSSEKSDEESTDEESQDDPSSKTPEWNRPPEQYQPKNKDLSKLMKKGGQQNELMRTNAPTDSALARQAYYDIVTGDRVASAPLNRPTENRVAASERSKKLVIKPWGQQMVSMPLPYGYTAKPGPLGVHEVVENGPGEFVLMVGDGTEEITVPLFEIQSAQFTAGASENTYLKPSGIPLSAWSADIQSMVTSLKGQARMSAAEALRKFIAEDGRWLYYSSTKAVSEFELKQADRKIQQLEDQGVPRPVAMAEVGLINCDGAAWIGALLLKDQLGIPARVVGGRTFSGKKQIGSDRFSVVTDAGPSHMWVEIWSGQQWVPLDFTPVRNQPETAPSTDKSSSDLRNDNKDDQESDPADDKSADPNASPESDPQTDSDPQSGSDSAPKNDNPPEPPSSQSQGQGSSQDPSRQNMTEQSRKAGTTDATSKFRDNKNDQKQDSTQPSTSPSSEPTPDKPQPQKPGTGTEEIDVREINDVLRAKSLRDERAEQQRQVLLNEIPRTIAISMLERALQEGQIETLTEDAAAIFGQLLANPVLESLTTSQSQSLREALWPLREIKADGLSNILTLARNQLGRSEIRESWVTIKNLERALVKLAEFRDLSPDELRYLVKVRDLLKEFKAIKHADSKEFDLIERIVSKLPGTAIRQYLRQEYGEDYLKLGSTALLQVAHDLQQPKLKAVVQVAMLQEYVDMFMNSTVEPRWTEQMTMNKALTPKPRQDIVVSRSPLDFSRFVWNLRPGEHRFAPTFQGRQFSVGSRETRQVVDPKRPLERRISVVYFDISASMIGKKAEVQTSLLMGFVDKAFSEVDVLGRPLHEIYLIPFDDKIKEGVHIKTREEAMAFVAQRMNKALSGSGDTDIQKAFLHFYDIVGKAFETRSRIGAERRFQKANMVLFTDGGSVIHEKTIEEARKQVPPGVQLTVNLVGLGSERNRTLETLAQNSNLSTSKPLVRYLENDFLSQVHNATVALDPEAFASTLKADQVPSSLYRKMDQLAAQRPDFRLRSPVNEIEQAIVSLRPSISEVDRVKDGPSFNQLLRTREVLSGLSVPPVMRQRILHNILRVYPRLTGRPLAHSYLLEMDQLQAMATWMRQVR